MKRLKDISMKEYSNMKIGGIAKELLIIENKEDLIEGLKDKENIFVIGNGTNTLLTDKYLNKTFVSLKGLQSIDILEEEVVRVEAGIDFSEVIEFTKENDFGGLENLAGIPGSLGGLVYMNGGAYGSEIFDCIIEVEVIDENLKLRSIKKEELNFSYRKTEIQEKEWIVISATFKFDKGFDRKKVDEICLKREGNHPLELPNLGSTFKNPKDHYSAKLIIEAGLQGLQVGGAQVSLKHPNFIVNHGEAKFDDVINLIQKVKEGVKNKSGIELNEEIIIVEE